MPPRRAIGSRLRDASACSHLLRLRRSDAPRLQLCSILHRHGEGRARTWQRQAGARAQGDPWGRCALLCLVLGRLNSAHPGQCVLTFAIASVCLRCRRSFFSIRAPPSTSSISSRSSSRAARDAPDCAHHGRTDCARGRACHSPRSAAGTRRSARACVCDCARPFWALCVILGGSDMSEVCTVVWYRRTSAIQALQKHHTPPYSLSGAPEADYLVSFLKWLL